jgi:hypothetical protein
VFAKALNAITENVFQKDRPVMPVSVMRAGMEKIAIKNISQESLLG